MTRLNDLANTLYKAMEDNEKVSVALLAAKFVKYADSHPYDQTIVSMARVLNRLADRTYTIKKSELKDLYHKHYTNNTQASKLLLDELGDMTPQVTVTFAPKQNVKELNTETKDKDLFNTLQSLLNKEEPSSFSKDLAKKVEKDLHSQLDIWELNPDSLKVVAGNKDFLVVQVDYESPKGLTTFYIPVELYDGKPVDPESFIGNGNPQDLNKDSVRKYLLENTGKKTKITANLILATLVKTSQSKTEVSGAELALARLKFEKDKRQSLATDYVLAQQLNNIPKDVKLPRLSEADFFEKKFASTLGQASFILGDDLIKNASDLIVKNLYSWGYRKPQLSVHSYDDKSVTYSVKLDGKVAFTVPMKVENKKVQLPSLLLCNGSVSEFSKKGVSDLYVNNQTDYKAAASASPNYKLKPSELIQLVSEGVAEGNLAKVEDALNILQQSDSLSYKTAFSIYLSGLKPQVKRASACSNIIKLASSQHDVCGHTHLPLHKVYQDDHGNCRPLYRQNMEDTYQAAMFMSNKILG